MTCRLCAYTLLAFAFDLLLLVNQARASRASDKHEALKAISHHSLLKTSKIESSSRAMGTKATKTDSVVEASAASTATGAKATKTDSSVRASVKSIAIGTKATLKKTTSKVVREDPEAVAGDAAEQTPKALCSVADDLQPDVALREIEHCVKQLEMIKEGTLEQGKTSWEHNNKYVKSLAGLENRMTELSRPEPFEIAFAVDQADMYEKLKNRLQAIQLDLPKLQGLPGAVPAEEDGLEKQGVSEETGVPDQLKEQDVPEAEDSPKEQDMHEGQGVSEVEDRASQQDGPGENDMLQGRAMSEVEDGAKQQTSTKDQDQQGEPKEKNKLDED